MEWDDLDIRRLYLQLLVFGQPIGQLDVERRRLLRMVLVVGPPADTN